MKDNFVSALTPILPESLCKIDPDISIENLSHKDYLVCKVECWDNNSHVLRVYLGNGIFGIVPEKEISIYPIIKSEKYTAELYTLVGRIICVKFIGFINNIPVLSRKLHMLHSFENLMNLQGQKINAVIKSSMRTAFFLDCGGGIYGMLPVQNYSSSMLNNIKDLGHKEGDKIDVIIKEVDYEKKRFLISYKDLFKNLSLEYSYGDIVQCAVLLRVSNTNDGYFCSINPSTNGILNVPSNMEDLKYASTVIAVVRGINSENKLKLRFLSK